MGSKKRDLRETYNLIAADWHQDHSWDTWWIEGTDKFLSMLPKGATILDVGCGAGVKAKYLADKGFKVTGVDFSEKMIDIARKEVLEVEFEVFDLYELDKFDRTFDALFAQASLLHIPKDRVLEVLHKFKTRLKPAGLLYLAVKEIKPDGPEEKVEKGEDYGYQYERFFSYFTLPELRECLRKVNLEVMWGTITPSGKTNWIQIVAKK